MLHCPDRHTESLRSSRLQALSGSCATPLIAGAQSYVALLSSTETKNATTLHVHLAET